MKNIKGPAIFLAQFAGDAAPFNTLEGNLQMGRRPRLQGHSDPDLGRAPVRSEEGGGSKTYCDEIKGMLAEARASTITELSTHLQGQLVAVNPAYDDAFDAFAPAGSARQSQGAPEMGGRAGETCRQGIAQSRPRRACELHRRLRLAVPLSLAAASARPDRDGFDELAKRWKPILDCFDEQGVDVGFELHPGEDVFDGVTFEMFLERARNHKRCRINYDPSHFVLQQLDYLDFIDIYHERICAFHVKDAEFNPTGQAGRLFGLPALGEPRRPLPLARRRPGRFRRGCSRSSPPYDYDCWAVLEWECCLKDPERGRHGRRALHRATTSST